MATDDLVTWADIQDDIGAKGADEALVTRLITAASQWANVWTGRKLASRAYATQDADTMYDGNGTNSFYLTQYPITAIASVYEDDDRTFATSSLIAATEYIYYPDSGKLLFDSMRTNVGNQNYRVYFTAGFVTVPEDLANQITILVDWWYKSYNTHRFGVKSTGVDDQRIVYEIGVPDQVKEALLYYKRMVLY